MKNKIFFLFFALVLIFVTLFVIFPKSAKKNVSTPSASNQEENKTKETKSDDANNIQATPKNYRESSEKYKYQISVNYPFFENLPDKKIRDLINSQTETKVQEEIDLYIAQARRNKITPAFGYLTGDYEYSIASENILSIKIEGEKYLSGATDSQNFSISIDYDLGNGKQISTFKD